MAAATAAARTLVAEHRSTSHCGAPGNGRPKSPPEKMTSVLARRRRRLIVAGRIVAAGHIVPARIVAGRIVVNRPSRHLCLGFGTIAGALRHPCALTVSGAALASPNAAAASHAEMAGAVGPLTAGLHRYPDGAVRGDASLHIRSFAAADNPAVNDLHTVANTGLAGAAAGINDHAPAAVITGLGNSRAGDTDADQSENRRREAGAEPSAVRRCSAVWPERPLGLDIFGTS
jgi:hypothetical protein